MTFTLKSEHRRKILDREYPHIPLNVEEAARIQPGQQIILRQFKVWITILGVGKDKRKGLYLRYSVRDDRPRYMRRNPHGMDVADIKRRTDSYGTPTRVSDQDAEEAIEASHYTSSPMLAVAEEGEEVVPVEFQNRLTVESRLRYAEDVTAEIGEGK